MTPPARRRFDATWLPFGMMVGFMVGVGVGLAVIDDLAVGAGIGFVVGALLGVMLGFRSSRGTTTDEDAEDDLYRAQHGDPAPRGAETKGLTPKDPS